MNLPQLQADCPRCDAKRTTFDVKYLNVLPHRRNFVQPLVETFATCRACNQATVFELVPINDSATEQLVRRAGELANKNLGSVAQIVGYVNTSSMAAVQPPDHLPGPVEAAFKEGAMCLSIACSNAAGSMLRLCLDLASKELLTKVPATAPVQPNNHQTNNLSARLDFLIDNGYLPHALHDLVHCIRDDGNVAAHQGAVTDDEAQEMMDLTLQVLNRVYTEPGNLAAVKARQLARKSAAKGGQP